MEDLVPFLIFIVIALVNLVKFILEKGVKDKQPPARPGQEPPRREPTSLEEFFDELAEKLEPKPTELPEWPEGRERPDYMQEMEEFEQARAEELEEEALAEPIPVPMEKAEPVSVKAEAPPEIPGIPPVTQTAALKSMMRSVPAAISNSKGMRIASAPILRSQSAGRIDFPLGNKADLKQAIIANLVFGPPRAYDCSFDNTIAK